MSDRSSITVTTDPSIRLNGRQNACRLGTMHYKHLGLTLALCHYNNKQCSVRQLAYLLQTSLDSEALVVLMCRVVNMDQDIFHIHDLSLRHYLYGALAGLIVIVAQLRI